VVLDSEMIPLVDMHVHLLAGLDDGPRTPEAARAMARMMAGEGVRLSVALAHQNPRWPAVTPGRVRAAAGALAEALRADGTDLSVFPCAEVEAHPDLGDDWAAGRLVSVADRGQFLLVEMPGHRFVDLRPAVRQLRQHGVRPVLAHPEQHPELLHEPGAVEQLIRMGCLIQVSSGSVTDPPSRSDARALCDWLRRGVVHLIGSDGHSPERRPPRLAAAYRQIGRWAGVAVADRVCSTHGTAILHGLPLHVPPPERPARRWFAWLR
jgi:protein-tyrosine phosphatase